MKNKQFFSAWPGEGRGNWEVSCLPGAPEGNEEKLLSASPLILDAAEWAFNLLQMLDDNGNVRYGGVENYLSPEGRKKWAEYVKAIRQVDPNEPLLPRERE